MHTNEFTRPALHGVTASTRTARPASLRPPWRLSLPAILLTALSVLAPASPASAAMTKISAVGVFDDPDPNNAQCEPPTGEFADFTSYPPIVITGNLSGCWYTEIESTQDNGAPSGVYLETGREYFIGELDGEPIEFTTTYKFESKWDPEVTDPDAVELHGRCQHPISDEFFDDVEGRLDFKDIVANGTFAIRGHIRRV